MDKSTYNALLYTAFATLTFTVCVMVFGGNLGFILGIITTFPVGFSGVHYTNKYDSDKQFASRVNSIIKVGVISLLIFAIGLSGFVIWHLITQPPLAPPGGIINNYPLIFGPPIL